MAQRLTILAVLLRTAHALVCRAPAMAAAPTRTSTVLMADVAPDHEEKVAKALKAMTGFANSYCKNTGTTYCEDLSIPAVRYSLGASAAARPTRTCGPALVPHCVGAGGAQRVGGAQGDAGRPTMPVPALRGQGGGGQGRLLELSLRAHARAARLPLHVHRFRAPATTCGSAVPPHARHTEAEQGVCAQALPNGGQRVRGPGESRRRRGGEADHRWYVHPVNGPRCRMHDFLAGRSRRARVRGARRKPCAEGARQRRPSASQSPPPPTP